MGRRFRTVRWGVAKLLVVGLLAGLLAGHVRLLNPSTGAQLAWSVPTVPVVIQMDGSDDLPDGSAATAIRLALQDWNSEGGSALVLVEDTDPEQQARRDWESSKLHTILFDEDGESGFFSGGGIVALTPVRFRSDGSLRDADVLFNGRDFRFSTSGEPGAFDVQAIATHELGHVAGFDHSGWSDAALYPWVEANDPLARGLSPDERGGLRSVYPATNLGTIKGSVARALDGSPVAGAHITVRDEQGRPLTSVLSGPNGMFTLRGLAGGRYWLNVLPLTGAVSGLNLSSGQVIDTDFSAQVGIGPVDHVAGDATAVGQLTVDPSQGLRFGRSTDSLPLRLVPGTTAGATLGGAGLVDGCQLVASDPDLGLENVTWQGGSVAFRVAVPAGEELGPVDLCVVAPDGEVSVLTGALEITPSDPVVSFVEPDGASLAGGTDLRIGGSGFRDGCRVVIGDRIYREGLPGGCQLSADGSLSLRLLPTLPGTHPVVVIDRSGMEGRLASGLVVDQRPVIATLFPAAGQSQGGTQVRITGSGFGADTRVLVDGVEQDGLLVRDEGRLEFVTRAGSVGAHTLEVVNASGRGAEVGFDFNAADDPVLLIVDPPEGERAGGELIDLSGTNLDPACRVIFGVDPQTGLGGSEASVIEAADGTSLRVLTPGLAVTGPVAVAIQDPTTGQASVLSGAFVVRSPERSGGGACASIGRPSGSSRAKWEAGAGWLTLLALVMGNALRKRGRLHRCA